MKAFLNLGDCVAGMQALPSDFVDLVVTSPPYNIGKNYSTYLDSVDRLEYLKWTRTWLNQVHRLMKKGGSLFLNLGSCPKSPLLPHEIIAERNMFVLQNTIHWIKSITVETRKGEQISAGHFKPIRSDRYLNDCHEYIFHLTKNGDTKIDRLAVGVPYADKSNVKRWGHTEGKDRRFRGNAWFIPYKTIQSKSSRPHPATFPVELVTNCIRLHGQSPGEIFMLDPFLGSGTAAVAAKAEGVHSFYGFEIDPVYLEEAKARLK